MSAAMIKACKPLALTPAQKAVLMCVAWYASDDGEFWYSIATISEYTCLCDRAVRSALQELVKLGLLSSEKRTGAATRYCITPAGNAGVSSHDSAPDDAATPAGNADPLSSDTPAADAGHPGISCTPAGNSPRQEMPAPPAGNAGVPRQEMPGTPAGNADDKQIQLLTTKKTNTSRASAQPHITAADLVALGVDQQHADDFMTTRKTKRAGAFTKTAFDLIQREAGKAGVTLADAIKTAAERSWTSFKADWLKNRAAGNGPARHNDFDQRDYQGGIHDF